MQMHYDDPGKSKQPCLSFDTGVSLQDESRLYGPVSIQRKLAVGWPVELPLCLTKDATGTGLVVDLGYLDIFVFDAAAC